MSEHKQDDGVIIKSSINRMLWVMIGDEHLVYNWWYSSNKAFDGLTPEAVYQSGAQGRLRVYKYVASYTQQ